MVSLSRVLDWAIPLGIILFLIGIFYSKFKNTFHAIGDGFKNIFSKASGMGSKAKSKVSDTYEVVYRV